MTKDYKDCKKARHYLKPAEYLIYIRNKYYAEKINLMEYNRLKALAN